MNTIATSTTSTVAARAPPRRVHRAWRSADRLAATNSEAQSGSKTPWWLCPCCSFLAASRSRPRHSISRRRP